MIKPPSPISAESRAAIAHHSNNRWLGLQPSASSTGSKGSKPLLGRLGVAMLAASVSDTREPTICRQYGRVMVWDWVTGADALSAVYCLEAAMLSRYRQQRASGCYNNTSLGDDF